MILNAVIRFFKTVLGFFVKAMAWLLFALGLWMPCLYLLVFLIICAFTGTSLTSVTSALIVGLVVSFIVGAVISYYIDKKKRAKKQVVRRKKSEPPPMRMPISVVESQGDDDLRYYDMREKPRKSERDYAPTGEEYSPKEPYAPPEREEAKTRETEPPPIEPTRPSEEKKSDKPVYDFRTEAELHGRYFEDEKKSRIENAGYDYENAARRKIDSYMRSDNEPPLVFRTRADRDMYIYEYSDRLEYYLRMPNNDMKLVDVRYKPRY